MTEVYSRLLAELRWCFVTLEQMWLKSGLLEEPGDIFFLDFEEIRRLVEGFEPDFVDRLHDLVKLRRNELDCDSQLEPVPLLVYGNDPQISVPKCDRFARSSPARYSC